MATSTTVSKEPPQQQPSTSPEEDSIKRNTDCVYFLVSPLTCNKGSECEFRHSENARNTFVDCYYWLNGNCKNANCKFRHPSLGPFLPPIATPQNGAKQAVPCIFFQQGYCLKGDRCPFLHGPAPPSAKIQQALGNVADTEAPTFKTTFGGYDKSAQPKMTFNANAPKVAAEAPRQPSQAASATPKVQAARQLEAPAAVKRYPPPESVIEEVPKHKGRAATLSDNGILRGRVIRSYNDSLVDDHKYQNGRDIDDSLRESSPGFDVFVDDDLREEEYYPNEDQYTRIRGREGTSLNDFDGGHHDDYNPIARVDTDIYHSRRGYDSYDSSRDKYDRERRGASSERPLRESAHYDKRSSYKSRSPDFTQNSDLRHRLSKHRKGHGLRSAINPDHNPDFSSKDQPYRTSRRDTRRSPVRDRPIASRLQGRLKLPTRSPPAIGGYSDREDERVRNRGRSSPSRSLVTSHQGRLRDRLSGRIADESNESGSFRGQIRKDPIHPNGVDFAPPKRLSDLRGPDYRQPQQRFTSQQSVSGGKLRDTVLGSSPGTDTGLSFDAPKPLSEILKRKRDAGTTASSAGVKSDCKEANVHIDENVNYAAKTRKHIALSSEPQQTETAVEENNQSFIAEVDEEEGEISNKKIKVVEEEPAPPNNENQPNPEEGSAGVDGEEQEYEEEYDQGDGEYEYEHDDPEGGYDLNGEETAEHDGDFMDEDDGDDDFAKQLGVSF